MNLADELRAGILAVPENVRIAVTSSLKGAAAEGVLDLTRDKCEHYRNIWGAENPGEEKPSGPACREAIRRWLMTEGLTAERYDDPKLGKGIRVSW